MIKQPVYFVIALILLAAVGWFVIDRVVFLQTAKRTTGIVTNVWGVNSRCGGRRSRHDCTNFYADVAYTPEGESRTYTLNLDAGSSYGHNRPVSGARLSKGGPVQIVYSPRKPMEAYEDTIMGVWGTPIILFFIQLVTFITSLTQPRSATRRYNV